jgi:hypothetical protein
MLFSIIKWVIISLTLIFLIHHLYTFLINTLTVPKIKDLVNKPNEQYKDIFATMHKNNNVNNSIINNANTSANTSSNTSANNNSKHDYSATSNIPDMTDELTSFLNDLKKTDNSNYPAAIPSSIMNNDSINNYSVY